MRWLQQTCVRLSFISILLCPSLLPPPPSVNVFSCPSSPALSVSSSLPATLEENSFVALDHSGISAIEFVSLLEETEFTILINAYPAPKVTWLKDGKAIPESYYTLTKTSYVEANR